MAFDWTQILRIVMAVITWIFEQLEGGKKFTLTNGDGSSYTVTKAKGEAVKTTYCDAAGKTTEHGGGKLA